MSIDIDPNTGAPIIRPDSPTPIPSSMDNQSNVPSEQLRSNIHGLGPDTDGGPNPDFVAPIEPENQVTDNTGTRIDTSDGSDVNKDGVDAKDEPVITDVSADVPDSVRDVQVASEIRSSNARTIPFDKPSNPNNPLDGAVTTKKQFPFGGRILVSLPENFKTMVESILKDSGCDTMQRIKAMERIGELLHDNTIPPEFRKNEPRNPTLGEE